MARLILGNGNSLIRDGRTSVIQTPGGCGTLRMAAEFFRLCQADTTVWVSTPTWANHMPLLGGAGLNICEYPYLNRETLAVDFPAMLETLEGARAGDVVLLHGCCRLWIWPTRAWVRVLRKTPLACGIWQARYRKW